MEAFPVEILAQFCHDSATTRALRCTCAAYTDLTAVNPWDVKLLYEDEYQNIRTAHGNIAAQSVSFYCMFMEWFIDIDGVQERHKDYFSVMRRAALEAVLMGRGDEKFPYNYVGKSFEQEIPEMAQTNLTVVNRTGTGLIETAYTLNKTIHELGAMLANSQRREYRRYMIIFYATAIKIIRDV